MNTDQHEQQLASLYKKTRDVGPSAQLDQSILKAAKQAPGSRARSVPAKADYWRLPAALASVAAVVVLSLLIVPLMLRETQQAELADYTSSLDDAVMQQKQAAPVASDLAGKAQPKAMDAPQAMASGVQARHSESKRLASEQAVVTESAAELNASADRFGDQSKPLSAEQWMKQIKQLVRDGQYPQAAEQLAQFRKAHPDYQVDESLVKTLKRQIELRPVVPN